MSVLLPYFMPLGASDRYGAVAAAIGDFIPNFPSNPIP